MKKFSICCVLLLACALEAAAQTAPATYRFDNFDLPDGVTVVAPEPPKASTPRKKHLRLTARGEARPVTPSVAKAAPAAEAAAPVSLTRRAVAPIEQAAGNSLAGFSTGDPRVDGLIVASSRRHGVDPVLIYAIMHRESAFKRQAVSHKGASGLMQLMPATARRFGVRNIFDPSENVEAGTRYMRWLLDKFDGDVRLALAGYNAGEGAVMKFGWRVPPYRETQEYVRRITERYALMRDPQTARRAHRVSRPQLAKLKSSEPAADLPLYEREVFAVRMPDGKLMLVSQ